MSVVVLNLIQVMGPGLPVLLLGDRLSALQLLEAGTVILAAVGTSDAT